MTKEKELIIDNKIKQLGYNKLVENIITQIELCKESLYYIKRKQINYF